MCLLKPTKEITHDPASGDMKIRTITTFRNFDMDFRIGEEFTENLGPVDGRTCQVCVADRSLSVQIKQTSSNLLWLTSSVTQSQQSCKNKMSDSEKNFLKVAAL